MEIKISDAGKVKVVQLTGELDTQNFQETKTQLMQLMDDGVRKILIDLEHLKIITSAGLHVFLATAKRLEADGGELRICGLYGFVQKVFDISGFSTILTVSNTRDEALEDF